MREADTATVTMVYLARLREALDSSGERIALPPDVSTVDALCHWLASRGGAWATELTPGRGLRIAVNHDLAMPDAFLRDGDEVAFFPPVTGG